MGWNEWPLILFTVLAQTAVGAFWVQACFLLRPGTDAAAAERLARGTLPLWILMGIAFAASTFHLGMPLRGINALNRVGAAPLSNEIVTGSAFFALGGLYWLLTVTGKGSAASRRIVLGVATLFSVLFLAAMTSFYLMPTVPTWNTPLTPAAFVLTALIAGLLLGRERLYAAGFTAPAIGRAMLVTVALAVLVSAIVTICQAVSLSTIHSSVHAAGDLVPDFAQLMGGRYLLLGAALIAWLIAERSGAPRLRLYLPLALVVVAESIGRGVFYGLHMTVGL